MVNHSFWQGRRVFLTGHTGFKGSWLTLMLRALGAKVTGFALPPPTEPNLFHLAKVGNDIESVLGDIRDSAALYAALASHQPSVVIHLAAQALVRPSYANPVETYATNVMGTVHLLDAVRRTGGIQAVVNVTSDKCYDNREWIWGYRENDALGGHDPYSSSKACAEIVGAAYRNSFFPAAHYAQHGLALASARAGNVIGGGDWARDRLVPDTITALMTGKAPTLRNPDAVRPWQHVLEPLTGYLLLAEKLVTHGPAYAEAWNFGPRDEDVRSVGWITEALVRRWEGHTDWKADPLFPLPQPHEATLLRLDSSKSRSRLGWQPQWSLEKGLDATVAWYRAHADQADMVTFTRTQIDQWLTRPACC